MNNKKSSTKAKTISELAGADSKAFGRFIHDKQAKLSQMKKDADNRTRCSGNREIVWAA